MQGEGRNTGRAAVFIRFAGCNLRCSFCDTEFESYREMSREEILAEISRYEVRGTRCEDSKALSPQPSAFSPQPSALSPQPSALSPLIVLTGGEPTLQVDEAFVDFLHQHGYEVSMESNGTRPAPQNLDWLTVSPKSRGTRYEVQGKRVPDEIKLVFDEHTDPLRMATRILCQIWFDLQSYSQYAALCGFSDDSQSHGRYKGIEQGNHTGLCRVYQAASAMATLAADA